jgi:hypothetical protein
MKGVFLITYFARTRFFYLQLYVWLDLFCGCAPYKYPTSCYYIKPETHICKKEYFLYENYQEKAAQHWLYRIVPRHRSQILWYDFGHWFTWALIGNDDHGIFSEAQLPLFKPECPVGLYKALAWMVRNPFHNFCHYVVGSADKKNDEWVFLKINRNRWCCFQYNPIAHTVFAGRYTSFFFGLHGGKPFISLRLAYGPKWKSDFYIGWREKGNFGIKVLPLTKNSLVVWKNLHYDDELNDEVF